MTPNRATALGTTLVLLLAASACSRTPDLRRFSLDTLEGVIQNARMEIDRGEKAQGSGSLRVMVDEPSVIRLFETGALEIDDATLVYRARLRTENVQGNVYLEMWCRFPGKGEFFSRGLESPLRGTNDWTTREIPFFLKKGEVPDDVKLNVVSEGSGVIWIDDIRLIKKKP